MTLITSSVLSFDFSTFLASLTTGSFKLREGCSDVRFTLLLLRHSILEEGRLARQGTINIGSRGVSDHTSGHKSLLLKLHLSQICEAVVDMSSAFASCHCSIDIHSMHTADKFNSRFKRVGRKIH